MDCSTSCLEKILTDWEDYGGNAPIKILIFSIRLGFIPGLPDKFMLRRLIAVARLAPIYSIAKLDKPVCYKSTSMSFGLFEMNLQIFSTIRAFLGVNVSVSPWLTRFILCKVCSLSSNIAFHCRTTLLRSTFCERFSKSFV